MPNPPITDDIYKAMTVTAQTVSVEVIGALTRKGLLNIEEAKEIIDRTLLNFEGHMLSASDRDKPVFLVARQICEGILAQISAQNQKSPR